MDENHGLSSRGIKTLAPIRDDLGYFFEALSDCYHPDANKEGIIILLMAENRLHWPKLKRKILSIEHNPSRDIPDWVRSYGDLSGHPDLKRGIANMMNYTSWIKAPVDPNDLVILGGVGAVIDSIANNLCEESDAIIIPGPLYSAFQSDVRARANVHLEVAPTQHEANYNPTVEELDLAYQRCVDANHPPKVLLICQPCNPTGLIYPADVLLMMYKWARSKSMHIFSDEIYGNSIFPDEKMISFADIMQNENPDDDKYLSNYVHVAGGLSKDFAVSGFRTGFLLTHNRKFKESVGQLGMLSMVGHYTQRFLIDLFNDEAFIKSWMQESRTKLRSCYEGLQAAMNAIDVNLMKTQGTIMAWADFRNYLDEPTFEAEHKLWLEIQQECKVLLTTGKSCGSAVPGFFRICFAYPETPEDDPQKAMRELRERLVKKFK